MDVATRRLNRLPGVLVALLAGIACALPAQAGTYEYTTVDYPGSDQTQVFGNNEDGLITGIGIYNAIANTAFVFDPATGIFTPLPTLPDYQTAGLGITESGVVVGSADNLTTGKSFGLIYREGVISMFAYPGALFTTARSVANSGLVTGYAQRDDGSITGFTYDPATGAFVDIVPSEFTIAQGINERGEIVGSAYLLGGAAYPGSPEGTYGFLRSKKGQVTFFRVNGLDTRARGISSTGKITGFVRDATNKDRGFVVSLPTRGGFQSLSAAPEDLLEVPDSRNTTPQAIDNAGNISGTYTDVNRVSHGFIARPLQ